MQLWQLRRRIHTSWLIATASLFVVIGTAVVPYIHQTIFGSVVWCVTGLGLLAFGLWRRAVYLLPCIMLAGLIIGLWRGSVLESQVAVYSNLIGKSATISGSVSEDPDIDTKGNYGLRLNRLSIDGTPVGGKIWVSATGGVDVKRGDTVKIRGVLSDGFGSFAATMYRAELLNVERPVPGDVARRVRDWFADTIRYGIPEPQVSLGLGYLLGQKRALPDDLQQALVVTGLTHVVVASGYNLTILVRLARRLFAKVSKYLSALSASVMIVGFMGVTGLSPSMSRAGLVSGLSLAAWYYGRKFHPLVLLPFAAAMTVLIDPSYAWNDLGWELSFAAFAGVMILAPLAQRYFFGDKAPGIIRQILGETISAQIVTMPILIFAFGQMSNVSVIANLLVLPLVPLAMLLVFVTGLAGLISAPLATVAGVPATALLTYMTSVINYFAGLSWALTEITVSGWVVAMMYLAIAGICVYLWKVTKYGLRDENLVE